MESRKCLLHFSKPVPAQSWFAVKHGKAEESSVVKSALFVWHKIPIRDTSLESGVTPKDLECGIWWSGVAETNLGCTCSHRL